MPEPNVEIHRRAVEAWNRGNWEDVRARYHEDVVLEDAELFPDGGVHRGIAAVGSRLEELLSFGGEWKLETERLLAAGDDVVWTGRVHGRLDEDTPPYDRRAGAVFTYRGGKRIRIRWFASAEDTLRAAGLEA